MGPGVQASHSSLGPEAGVSFLSPSGASGLLFPTRLSIYPYGRVTVFM